AGPVGLTAAIDLAKRGRRSVVVDPRSSLSFGSRAVCWSKRTLEIMDRLGFAQALLDKGVTWKRGKVLLGTRQIYEFDLLPETGYRMPAFVNLQQYYVEHFCVEAAAKTGLVELRWQEEVTGLEIQVGDEADREAEVRPENAARRVRAALGEDVDFSFEWISLYRFQSRRLQRFRHGRVLFAGDAAHQMSPFGARGGNSGVQDA